MKKVLTLSTKILKGTLITLTALFFTVFLTISIQFYKKNHSKRKLYQKIQKKNWQDLDINKTTFKTLGSPGASTFKNLFLHNNNFLINQVNHEKTDLSKLFNPKAKYKYAFKKCDDTFLTDTQLTHRSKKLPGTTLILSSSDEMKSMQPHYFHFCEEFLLAWSTYKHENLPEIKTIIFPDTDKWRGRANSINKKLIQAVAPDAQVISASELDSLSKKYLLQFENAVIVDRHTCHLNDDVNFFNKMIISHVPYIRREYIQEIREALLKHLHTRNNTHNKPFITYIRRNSYRFLEPEFEKKLLSEIQNQFPNYSLNPVWFENYTFAEQLQIIRNTKVLIGAHGNGLTHELFLPSNSLVIEIFPEKAYSMDYQLFAELCGHEYFALDPLHGVISKSGNRMPAKGNVNQTIHKFDTNILTDLIHDFESKLEESNLKETSLSE